MVVGNLSLIAHTYHQTLSQSASIVSVFAWTYAIATPLLALSTNRFNKRSFSLPRSMKLKKRSSSPCRRWAKRLISPWTSRW
ncbi:hypothetical protein CD188_03430 [Limosilactobacillus fermentum]|uniref:Uncharacterized protein n=1 Tax=Limosilactobacillus fermentum TaxID=1613 RepID=A0A1L7GSZ4_LIMFE|nr:hypothetical protein BUW47_01265 [Limosilactobacillus fermentum]AWV29891.1 hypothetical protein CD188_03430 [Limosilactobacillus fermentum]